MHGSHVLFGGFCVVRATGYGRTPLGMLKSFSLTWHWVQLFLRRDTAGADALITWAAPSSPPMMITCITPTTLSSTLRRFASPIWVDAYISFLLIFVLTATMNSLPLFTHLGTPG
jgi:hypothetical protein